LARQAERDRHVLSVAEQLFLDKGYHQVSLALVARSILCCRRVRRLPDEGAASLAAFAAWRRDVAGGRRRAGPHGRDTLLRSDRGFEHACRRAVCGPNDNEERMTEPRKSPAPRREAWFETRDKIGFMHP
jgi:hypothetical protein